MAYYLGLDTSNYTTSVALYDTQSGEITQAKKLLPVKPGEKGIRQSEAVFHHTVQLPELLEQLDFSGIRLAGIGVSVRPRNVADSYMPCFLCGQTTARALGHVQGIPVYETSHQTGHILAGLYSAKALAWTNHEFLAFHVSGGTTDCVLCTPDSDSARQILQIHPVSSSLDLKAGQLIDRVGVMLGLKFPCGAELERLAMQSRESKFAYHPVMRDLDCSLSGLENQCRKLCEESHYEPGDVAMFCLTAIAEVLKAMTERAIARKQVPFVLYAGGVMSDRYLQEQLENYFKIYPETEFKNQSKKNTQTHIRAYLASRPGTEIRTVFAEPAFSCDNAAGVAIYASMCDNPDRSGIKFNI